LNEIVTDTDCAARHALFMHADAVFFAKN